MTLITKDEFNKLYQEAPEGTKPEDLITSLQQRGHSLDGLQSPTPTPDKSYFSKVISDLTERGKNVLGELTPQKPEEKSLYEKTVGGLMKPARVVGQAIGAVGDIAAPIIGAGAKKFYEVAYSEEEQKQIEEGVKNVLNTQAGQMGLEAIQGGLEMYEQFKEANPNIAKDLEAVVNIASIFPAKKLLGGTVTKGLEEASQIGSDFKNLITSGSTENIPQEIQNVVEAGIEKGIRPSVAGKTGPGQMKQFYEKAKNGVLSIITNRDNLKFTDEFGEAIEKKLPDNLRNFGEAIQQTKKSIFDEYSKLTTAAGETGESVKFNKIIPELEKAVNDKVLKLRDPSVAEYASNLLERFKQADSLTPEEAEDFIKQMNTDLQAFYKNPQYGSGSKVALDALVANNMRESLDSLIEKATGEQYQQLKNAYGSLKAIEKEVNHRAIVDARKNNKGLIDFSDIFTYGDIAAGIGTGNLAQAGRGVLGKAVAEWYKFKNNPNNIIKGMFQDVEKLLEKQEKGKLPFNPESTTGKIITPLVKATKNLPVGMSIKETPNAINEAIQQTTKNLEVAQGRNNKKDIIKLNKQLDELYKKRGEINSK